ncbi:MAG: carboxypeptidase regulatory-like domain-containing protein, partial [bacterium]
FSLIEVVITVLIVSIAFLSLTKGFMGIGRGLIRTQNRTIAVNLANEKVETLKKLTYPRLYVTTTTPHDTVYYPPVTYTIKRKEFTRYVTVRKVRETPSGDIEVVDAADPDEGLKRIKVEVTWTENENAKTVTIYNLRQNPDRAPLSGTITGRVRNALGGGAIMAATVYVVENPNWSASTDVNGDYEIKVSTGDWNLNASKKGYLSKQADPNNPYAVTEGDTVNIDIDIAGGFKLDLTAMGEGKVRGYVIISTGGLTPGATVPCATITCNDETSDFDDSDVNGYFELLAVSTGTWTIFATTGTPLNLYGSTTVVVEVPGDWVDYDILLDTDATSGSISGLVFKDDSGDHKDIKVSGGGSESFTKTTGSYTIENVDAGTEITVTANPGGDNPSYTTDTTNVDVSAGQNVQADTMRIYPAGKISGTVYTAGGVDPFPGMVVRAVDNASIERGVGLSDANGYYEITQVPTQMGLFTRNPYTVTPILDEEDVSVPVSVITGVVKGENASGCDFTITRAWGYISGNVTDTGEPITTGVLIIASTGTISNPPPDMAVGATGNYGGISLTEGEYEIKVRVVYTYNVYAWYTTINDSWDGTETTRKNDTADLTGDITAQVNFAWP